jgi:hypothetical protein
MRSQSNQSRPIKEQKQPECYQHSIALSTVVYFTKCQMHLLGVAFVACWMVLCFV